MPSVPVVRRPARTPLPVHKKLLFIAIVVGVMVAFAELAVRPFTPREIVGPSAVRHDPVYGRALIPGYSGTVTVPGETYRLTVNSLGFRGPEPASDLTGCVLFLGDSYTMGDAVDNGEEFPQIVGAALDGAPVVNAGMAGQGQGRWIKHLDRRAPDWNPRCVVMQFCTNDFRDNHQDGLFTLAADGTLIEQPIAPETPLRALQRHVERIPVLAYSRLYALAKRAVAVLAENPGASASREGIPPDDATETGPFDDITFALVRDALDRCHDNGWPVVGVTAQFAPGPRLDRLRAEFDRAGAPLVVIPPKDASPELHHTIDDHWNPEGHRVVAGLLAGEIDRIAPGTGAQPKDEP
jgi:hypothetical protein